MSKSVRKPSSPALPAMEALIRFAQADYASVIETTDVRRFQRREGGIARVTSAARWECLYHFACRMVVKFVQPGLGVRAALHADGYTDNTHQLLLGILTSQLQQDTMQVHNIVWGDGRYLQECEMCKRKTRTGRQRIIYGDR